MIIDDDYTLTYKSNIKYLYRRAVKHKWDIIAAVVAEDFDIDRSDFQVSGAKALKSVY